MKPVICRVKHDPPHSFGDCVRACVASILELQAEDVPHFYHACDGETALNRMREWLATKNYAPFIAAYDGGLSELLALQTELNPTTHYVLYGQTQYGDHAVVCCGGEVVHNPSWLPSPIIEKTSGGFWVLLTISVK